MTEKYLLIDDPHPEEEHLCFGKIKNARENVVEEEIVFNLGVLDILEKEGIDDPERTPIGSWPETAYWALQDTKEEI